MNVAGVILNGGQSSRMGENKSQLQVAGVNLLEHSMNQLTEAGLNDIFISGPDGIQDIIPSAGPLSGIHAALHQLLAFEALLIIPVDMPLVGVEVLAELLNHNESDLIHYQNEHFPLLIKNHSQMRNHISQQLADGHLAIHMLIKTTDSLSLPNQWPADRFSNANTQEQWQSIKSLIKQ